MADLKALRKSRGLTQAELGAKVGRIQQWVAKLERGETHIRNISSTNLIKLAQALDVSIEELLDDGGKKE